MRILWVDADQNPWTDSSGWKTMEDFGVEVRRVSSTREAQGALSAKQFEALVVRAEIPGAQDFLVAARKSLAHDSRKIVLISSKWKKDEFKAHSKTPGAAHRYARVPMPPEGFLGLLADLFGLTIEELREFQVASGETPADEPAVPPAVPARRKVKQTQLDSEDVEVLRKYLRIKEEQLEIAEANKEELVNENERLQKECRELQVRMRELEHLHDELGKKVSVLEEEKEASERTRLQEGETHEAQAKVHAEKIRSLEAQLSEANERYENLRVRVRKDIRKIRANERDLEARLELLRKDSETLLSARDHKVLELQRKIDALEFDLDQVQDSRVQAQMESERYLAKLSRVARALHLAVSMIEQDHPGDEELEELEPLVGGAANAEDTEESPGDSDSGAQGASGSGSAPPAGAEPPPSDDVSAMAAGAEELSPDLAALAADGEPTRMVSPESLDGEPES